MRKRFYIFFVARDEDGRLHKISIPIQYLYVFVLGTAFGFLGLTGMAGSYVRMAMKVARFNQLRTEKDQLKGQYSRLEQVAQERGVQVASLGSLASEVSTLYGLKPAQASIVAANDTAMKPSQVSSSLDQLYVLKTTALSGAATMGLSLGLTSNSSTADWYRANSAPSLWPVEGTVTGSFGERADPFNGEGAFHAGVDISAAVGTQVVAPADGIVTFAEQYSGYGRLVMIDHANGLSTRYGHLASFSVVAGERVQRGDVIGFVGQSGRSTGPHLHYEVRIHDTPVNPYKFLRTTVARAAGLTTSN